VGVSVKWKIKSLKLKVNSGFHPFPPFTFGILLLKVDSFGAKFRDLGLKPPASYLDFKRRKITLWSQYGYMMRKYILIIRPHNHLSKACTGCMLMIM